MPWLLVADSEQGLPGEELASLLSLASTASSAEYVAVSFVEGAGDVPARSQLVAMQGDVRKLRGVLPDIRRMTQFDWGDFHLLRSSSDFSADMLTANLEDVLGGCACLIRCVDSGWIYVYGEDTDLRDALLSIWTWSESLVGGIRELPFPD